MNEFDLTALALICALGYQGYRRGLIAWVLGATGIALAFGVAAMLQPGLADWLTHRLGVSGRSAAPVALIGLTLCAWFGLRFAVRELVQGLRAVLHELPATRYGDHLLGALPGAAVGLLIITGMSLFVLTQPFGNGLRGSVSDAWVVRSLLPDPLATRVQLVDAWDHAVYAPPRVGAVPLGLGLVGLIMGAVAARRMRTTASAQRADDGDDDFTQALTQRITLPAGGGATVERASWLRTVAGLAAAGAISMALLLIIRLRV